MKNVLLVLLYTIASLTQPALADDAHHKKADAGTTAQAPAMTEGEVRKVDKAAKKITLKHGPIANLDMPGMTMVFHVANPALLKGIKAGDKVKFFAEKVGENIAVTKIEPVR